MILIALGSNMAGPWGEPAATLDRTVTTLGKHGIAVVRASRWLRSAPMGPAGQAEYVNGAVIIESHLPPAALIERMHAIERLAGRIRRRRWGPRTLDLDLIDYRGLVRNPHGARATGESGARGDLILPHPGLAERPFVLVPLGEIAPFWHHPVTGLTAAMMLERLRVRREGRILD